MYSFSLIYGSFIVILFSSVESKDASVSRKETRRNSIQPLVYGGTGISINKAPYMALYFDEVKGFGCGATIVHKRFLLSAAHCYNPFARYYVKVGTDTVDGGYRYDIEKIIIHPNYNALSNNNDISVIKLMTELRFSRRVQAIKMAPRDTTFEAGAMMTTMGFGLTSENDCNPSNLTRVEVPYVNHHECRRKLQPYNITITSSMICAGEIGKDSCQGDSGGPLIHNKMLVGIVSFGKGCGEETPGVYTSVPALRGFIDWTIRYLSNSYSPYFYLPW